MSDVTAPIEERLKNGAKILGQLFRSGQRCEEGWACGCSRKISKLCIAKGQWLALAVQAGRPLPDQDGPYALIETMTPAEFDASGLTLTAEIHEIGTVKIGPKGQMSMADLLTLAVDPASAKGTFKVLQGFPGSRVVKIEEPKKAEVKA
jgi:hypothetical protein